MAASFASFSSCERTYLALCINEIKLSASGFPSGWSDLDGEVSLGRGRNE